MLHDIHLLKIFCVRKVYLDHINQVNVKLLDYHMKVILQDFGAYYEIFDNDIENLSEFEVWFKTVRHPELPEATQIIYKSIIEALSTTETTITQEVIKEYQKKHLIKTLEEHFTTGFNIDYVQTALDEYKKSISSISNQDDEDLVNYELSDLLQEINKEVGLKWRLDGLNRSIGAIKRGYLIIIGAFVDVGKTSFAISEATYMARQLKEGCVLWLNNEEEDYRVLRKIWKSTLNCKDSDLMARPDQANKAFIERMGGDKDRIKLINIRKKTMKGIATLFEKYNPSLVVIDQADKIANPGFKAFTDHGQLKNIYGELRHLANSYCPILAISQADATAMYKPKDSDEYKYTLYPHHRQLDGSKVGKPGEADAIIMIGRRAESNTTRGIHVSKNKFGDSNFRQEVPYNGETCRYDNPKGEIE